MLEESCSAADAIYLNSPRRSGSYRPTCRHCERQRRSGVRRRLGSLVRNARVACLALLGRGELGRLFRLDDLDRSARFLDRLAGALRDAGDPNVELRLELALAEEPDSVAAAASEASALE